jgi:hypothetical protein
MGATEGDRPRHQVPKFVELGLSMRGAGGTRQMPKEDFKKEVEKELTGRETEPWEIIYFKLYQSQMPVETAALMLGSDRYRGYCLEMICADFMAGANLDNGDPETLLFSMTRFFRFLPENQRRIFLENVNEKAS